MGKRIGITGIFALFFWVITPGITFGQTSADSTLSLKDCIQIALQNKVDVKIAKDQLGAAAAQQQAAFGNYFPNVNMSFRGSHTEQGEGKRFFSGLEYTSAALGRDYYSAGLDINETVFNGFSVQNNRKLADLNYNQAQVGYLSAKQKVILNVTKSYLDVLRARELVRVYQKTLESSQAQVNLVKERYNLGAVAQTDVYKAQTKAGNDKINLLQQTNTLDLQKRTLNVAMGRNPMEPIALPDFEYSEPVIPDEQTAKSEALRANKDLKSMELDVHKSRANLAIAKSNLIPSVGAYFSYDRTGFQLKELYTGLDKNWSYSYGINLSIPIFNRFNNSANVKSRQADFSIAQKRYVDAKLQVEMQVDNLIQQLKTYGQIIDLNQLNLKSAEEDLRLAREQYNVGQATLLDVLDAQANLTNAQRILVYAKFDAKNLEYQLQAVLGKLTKSTTSNS